MPSIVRRVVLSFIVPPLILVFLSLAFPFLQSLETGFPGISCGLFDLFRVHIVLMWLGWSVILYLFLFVYDVSKKLISNLTSTSNQPVIRSYFEANQKYHLGSIRIIFAVIITIYLWLAGGIITKSLYFFYDVNNGVFLASDIVFMFRQYAEVSYLIMILVIYGTFYLYDKKLE
ncbi:hypothetical protein KHC33_04130 [Methanospirillum sp. J.3.6.1-F.2.7.3]|uniref:Uncharacterized protein n=1 Tax=Methanospirillum purgamenti TaxID=2834276 RepID=A0A8E7B271_9EURY|nr:MULTISPECIES: hypothetical protein [Methanospirillum]MDX8551771.1 hypothetical protein [Methanospirillum hungatei]QVV89711.1 hypothetical protein KHC33_04130 [Methanospirillum sp. J.3.6.1-F.2.7.3]